MELRYPCFPQAYADLVYLISTYGVVEQTRNGPAFVMEEPVLLHISNPRKRVIADSVRNANPFFHVMETVWMLAGAHDPRWLEPFNKRIMEYADGGALGTPVINGAYGYRWLRHWKNQIADVIRILTEDPTSRQAVLAMWDPHLDLRTVAKDRPCNTHIYFRVREGCLEMTVCNRSNDLVWGMMGANAVHMSYLHEFIATAIGQKLGGYSVITNNLHFYTELYPNGKEILARGDVFETIYPRSTFPILSPGEDWSRFLLECKMFLDSKWEAITCQWLRHVAFPMYEAYKLRQNGRVDDIAADDWREACKRWLARNRR